MGHPVYFNKKMNFDKVEIAAPYQIYSGIKARGEVYKIFNSVEIIHLICMQIIN